MVLLIDTSSARSAVAVLSEIGELQREVVAESGPAFDLAATVLGLVDPAEVRQVGVATGPGSFTGLRIGAAYAVGLAMGLGIELRGLPTLEVAAARASFPVTAASEAGRGRIYFQPPGGSPALGAIDGLPVALPVVGWLREKTDAAIVSTGRRVLDEAELRSFGEAAWLVFKESPKLPYARVKLEYMQPFGLVD